MYLLCIGASRGFAFVEFNATQEAARWMEMKQVEKEVQSRYPPDALLACQQRPVATGHGNAVHWPFRGHGCAPIQRLLQFITFYIIYFLYIRILFTIFRDFFSLFNTLFSLYLFYFKNVAREFFFGFSCLFTVIFVTALHVTCKYFGLSSHYLFCNFVLFISNH